MSAITLAVCLGWSAAARADEPAALFEDGADLLSQARTLYAEGTNAANLRQWDLARTLFLSAWRAQHQWQIAANLGHAELALGRYRDAAEHLTIFLRETGDLAGVDPRDRATLAREQERARAKIGVVTVSVEPPGAEVLVDGVPAGKAPLADAVFVEPGRHVIEARADGRTAVAEPVDLGPGGAAQVTLRLPAVPKADAGPQPPAPVAREVPARGGASKAIVVGGFVTSAVALGMGAGFSAWSSSAAAQSNDARHACAGGASLACGDFHGPDHTRWVTGNVAAYSFVAAGALALGTTTYALIASSVKRGPRVMAFAGPGGAAAGLSVDW